MSTNINKFRKLLAVAFTVAVLMLTAGTASASMVYYPDWNILRIEGGTSVTCDPNEECWSANATVEIKVYANGTQIGHAFDSNGSPGADGYTYSAWARYDVDNPNFSANTYTATIEYWTYSDAVGSNHYIEHYSY